MKTLLTILFVLQLVSSISQTTNFSFTAIPFSSNDINSPGRGLNTWYTASDWPSGNTLTLTVYPSTTITYGTDLYIRPNWAQIEAAGSGTSPATVNRFNWEIIEDNIIWCIDRGMRLSFGILPIAQTYGPFGSPGGGALGYPTYLHNQMQALTSAERDYVANATWIPNWNSTAYLNAHNALLASCSTFIADGTYTPTSGPKAGQLVRYRDVIQRIDIRGYGDFGEWHMAGYGTPPGNQAASEATLKSIVNQHKVNFPNYKLSMIMNALSLSRPFAASFAGWVLNNNGEAQNNVGRYGIRRDNVGQPIMNLTMECNPLSGVQALINEVWKTAPIDGEPSRAGNDVTVPSDPSHIYWDADWCGPCSQGSKNSGYCTFPSIPTYFFGDYPREVRDQHISSVGNGNYDPTVSLSTGQDSIRMASKWMGYRLVLTGGSTTTTLIQNTNANITVNWQNVGVAPNYEAWDVVYELQTSTGTVVRTWNSTIDPRGILPSGSSTSFSENFAVSTTTPGTTYKLVMYIRDSTGYRSPLPLAISSPARNADGGYTLRSNIPVQAAAAPEATKNITVTSDRSYAMNGGVRVDDRNPFLLVDGSTSTQICNSGGVGDAIYFPQHMLYELDSPYNTIKVRVYTGSGSPTITMTLFSENFTDSLVVSAVGGFNVWNWVDTTATKAWAFNTRWIQFDMPSCISLKEMEVWGNSTGVTPVQYWPNSDTVFNTPYTDFAGENSNSDEPDSLVIVARVMRFNYNAFYMDTATVGITVATHKYIFSRYNDISAILLRLRDSGMKVFLYSQGPSAANMNPVRPYDAGVGDQYTYYNTYNTSKNIPYGSDSLLGSNWLAEHRMIGAAAAYFGNNESANIFGYTVTFSGGSVSPGMNLLMGMESGNEDRRYWSGLLMHHTNRVIINKISGGYDTAHAKDPSFKFIQGANFFPDTMDLKAQAIYAYRKRGYNNYPADIYAFNHYVTDAGGQSQAPTFGLSPENGELYEELVAFKTVARKYIGAKKLIWTELGWDASQTSSYRSKPIGAKSARRVAADWLVRAYHIARTAGIDGAFHYRLVDGSNNLTSPGSFLTMGLTTTWNANPDSVWKKWPAWYGLNTTRLAYSRYAGSPTIVQRQDSTGLWILRDDPESGDSVTTYTLWMPTGDGSDTSIVFDPGQTIRWVRKIDISYGANDLSTGDNDGTISTPLSTGSRYITLNNIGETPVTVQVIFGTNSPPVASAGADQNTTSTSVTLNGSGSTDNVGIISYLWEKISGTGGTIATPTTVSTSVTGLSVGTYVFRLTVTDDAGAQHTDNVTVNITDPGAVTYYIDFTGGLDANNGTSTGTAWKTIAKINSSTFAPGDFILFKRGEMWREQLIIPSSGTAGNLITFGAYGTGEKPIINGADITTGWTTSATNVWWTTSPNATTTRAMVIIDGVIYSEVASVALVNSANEYFIDVSASPDRLYVFSTTDPDNLVAEVSKRNYGFIARDQDDRHHCSFINLEFRYTGTTGLQLEGEYQGAQVQGNFVVDSCFFYANRAAGCDAHDGVTDNVFKNSVATYNGNGFYAWISDNVTMQNCSTAHNINYQSISLFTDGHGFGVYAGDNFIIENCESFDDAGGAVIDAGGAANGGIIRYNYFHNSQTFHPGISTGNLTTGDTIEIYYNLLVNNGGTTGTAFEDYLINTGVTLFYNNTIYNNTLNGGNGTIFLTNGDNIVFKNNIVMSERGDFQALLFNQNPALLTSDYNQWFQLDSVNSPARFHYNGTYRNTLANWQAGVSQDLNSQSGDPLFVNKASDWTLQATSPAINKGVNVGLTVDFDGNPIIGLPDMGAFEFSDVVLQKIKTRFRIKRN